MREQSNSVQTRAVAIVASLPETEQALLLNWAQQVLAVRASGLSAPQKIGRIVSITRELGMTKPLVAHLAKEVQRVAWDERSKPMRGVIGGAGAGLLLSVASPMAGLAAFGGAIAIPVILLGAGGGALLMAIVDELSAKK